MSIFDSHLTVVTCHEIQVPTWNAKCDRRTRTKTRKMSLQDSLINKSILFLLLITPILAEWNTRDYIRREHSLTKPYQGEWPIDFVILEVTWLFFLFLLEFLFFKLYFLLSGSGMSVPYWDFLGSTIVTTNYVRLTPDLQSKAGAIWNTVVSYFGLYSLALW